MSAYNTISVHWNHAAASLIWPSLKEPFIINDGLDLMVENGVWYFVIIKIFSSYLLIPLVINKIYLCLI